MTIEDKKYLIQDALLLNCVRGSLTDCVNDISLQLLGEDTAMLVRQSNMSKQTGASATNLVAPD